MNFRNTYPRGGSYLRGLQQEPGAGNNGMQQEPSLCDPLSESVMRRHQRIDFLLREGEPFWLPVSLGLGTTPTAGRQFQSVTTPVDFDLLLIGAAATIFKSSIDIRDSARQRILTNAPTPIGHIADFNVSGSLVANRNFWDKPYMLPARSQIAITVTADGTESDGIFTFYCLQPPTYSS
ncbi:MAG: hypothetical protein BWY07_01979 [Candidatus Hydrogenedentes bacterium ADurb.Bin170]|nr:MAG: hypothetical protein BWY07_01979 [Candidatus Hydrogenedentes bacterium ADurb.Bin170]